MVKNMGTLLKHKIGSSKIIMTKPSTPSEKVPRDILRRRLRNKIGDKMMNRHTKSTKKQIVNEQMTKMEVDMEKFNDAIKTLNKQKSFEALLSKK